MKRIVCFHLLNDYSGSPKVLKMVIEGLLERGVRIDLVTSRGGILDELDGREGLKIIHYNYRFSTNNTITSLRYLWVQIYTFFLSWRYLMERNSFYINTLLPIGAALAGRLTGKRVVYHYHENAWVKGRLYKLLCRAMQCLANEIICVSCYQRSFLRREKGVTVVPNALSNDFTARIKPDIEAAFRRQSVLMLASLKLYKGIREFTELAKRLPQYNFLLVVNDTQANIDAFFEEYGIVCSPNVTLYPRQNDVVPFYHQASIVVNLSNRELSVETFGLTVLEAMSAGLPVIVPTVGGVAEMVTDGVNGYKIDAAQLDRIAKQTELMLSDRTLYGTLAEGALNCAMQFDENRMITSILTIL